MCTTQRVSLVPGIGIARRDTSSGKEGGDSGLVVGPWNALGLGNKNFGKRHLEPGTSVGLVEMVRRKIMAGTLVASGKL